MKSIHLLMAIVILVLFAIGQSQPSLAAGPPQLQKAKGDVCVAPTEWMRRNHMDFLKNRREQTVREGMRKPEESLANCATCHTSREQFCDRCHSYVGVKPDCFECHHFP